MPQNTTRPLAKLGFGAALVATVLLAGPVALKPVLAPSPALAHGGHPGSFADLVRAAKPAVVTVLTKGNAAPVRAEGPRLPNVPPDHPLHDFFERFFDGRPAPGPGQGQPPRGTPRQAQGLGSGFVIDSDGVIVTNNHVIEGAEEIRVVLDDGTELSATLVGADPKTDIAVLRAESSEPLATVPWGDSDHVAVGDWVVAIGNPFGLGGTVTSGIISARGRDINAGPYDDFMQVDAAINRGNSGGPLFDTDGQVVGINTAIFSPNGGNVGVGFAVPSNQAKDIVAQILETGSVERGFIGVRIQPLSPAIAENLGLAAAEGALIADLDPEGPAGKAGLRAGDVILDFAGTAIREVRDLTRAVAATEPGAAAAVEIWRRGERVEVDVTVATFPKPGHVASAPASAPGEVEVPDLGLTLGDRDGAAVVLSVAPEGAQDLRPGDVIVGVGQRPVASAQEVRSAVERARSEDRRSVLLLVRRGEEQRYVAMPLRDA
jgi:serine protease Do